LSIIVDLDRVVVGRLQLEAVALSWIDPPP
jgi:hypothetical protein